MIQDVNELSASLQYASRWADMLEGLRRHAEETNATLLPTTSAGPLAEIRRVLGEAREFVEGLAADADCDTGGIPARMDAEFAQSAGRVPASSGPSSG